jgi:hypothetical protein
MALDTLVVCPHAIGNLGHCLDGINCIVPEFTEAGLLSGVKAMLALPPDKQLEYIEAGREMAVCHRIENERAAVIDLLDRAHDLWKQPDLFLPCAPKPTSIWRRLLTKWF